MRTCAPRRVVHVDLAAEEWPEALDDWRDVHVVWWWRELALGTCLLGSEQARPSPALTHLAARAVAPAVRSRLEAAGATWDVLASPDPLSRLDARLGKPSDDARPSICVIVCTRGRPDDLERCLASLQACAPAADEILVVDNAPSLRTRDVVASFPDARYVCEPRPGLSVARNTGIRHAHGQVIAFTDDDVQVHPGWVGRLSDAFVDPETVTVTGLVLPAALDTPAQVYFETVMGGFGRGFQPQTFGTCFFSTERAKGSPVWRLGAGANMALRRAVLEELGGFDERLGAGAAGCSEDSELWYRLLAAGYEHRYEPSAVVFHHHRQTMPELRRQVRAYVRGHVAALFVQFARHRHWGNLRRALLTLPWWYIKQAVRALPKLVLGHRTVYPDEVRGYLSALRLLPLAARPAPPPMIEGRGEQSGTPGEMTSAKARSRVFLGSNPYPHPWTEGGFYREKMRAIHRVARGRPPRRLLDIGGGQSGLASLLFPQARVTTIDVDLAYASSPSNRQPNQRFLAAHACHLPFADASFDAVTLFDVLEHIPDDANAVQEALRVLRPGGWALVTSPNERWRYPYYRVMARVCPTEREVMADWGHVRRGYTIGALADLFKVAPSATATFITPMTVVGHDLAFSSLPQGLRRLACATVTPLTWLGYLLHRPTGPGTETATFWRKPATGA